MAVVRLKNSNAYLLVTRPCEQAQGILSACKNSAGANIKSFPLLEILPKKCSACDLSYVENLDQYYAVIFVSGNAVRMGLQLMDERWPQWPQGVHYFCMGQQSQTAAQLFGLETHIPRDGFDSEAVLRMHLLSEKSLSGKCLSEDEPATVGDKKILIVRGQQGRTLLGDTLQARGAQVHYLQCYERAAPHYSKKEIDEALGNKNIAAIQVNSAEVLHALCGIEKQAGLNIKQITILAISDRVANLAKAAGFTQVVSLNSAADEVLLEAWRQLT